MVVLFSVVFSVSCNPNAVEKAFVSKPSEVIPAGNTVTFETNGYGEQIDSSKVLPGEKITKPENDPKATGYTFDGWFKESECLTEWDFDSDNVDKDITLYTKWTKTIHCYSFIYPRSIML